MRFITPLQKQRRPRGALGPRTAALECNREARGTWSPGIEVVIAALSTLHAPARCSRAGRLGSRMRDEKGGSSHRTGSEAQASCRRELDLVEHADDKGEALSFE